MPAQVQGLGIDWSDCPLVERNPLKLSGVPLLKHTRVQAGAIVETTKAALPSKKSPKLLCLGRNHPTNS